MKLGPIVVLARKPLLDSHRHVSAVVLAHGQWALLLVVVEACAALIVCLFCVVLDLLLGKHEL